MRRLKGLANVFDFSDYKKFIDASLDFLVRSGIAVRTGEEDTQGVTHTHLGKDSPLISKHRINWRMRAIESLENKTDSDLHDSAVAALSRELLDRVKAILVKAINKTRDAINGAEDETVAVMCLDVFEL